MFGQWSLILVVVLCGLPRVEGTFSWWTENFGTKGEPVVEEEPVVVKEEQVVVEEEAALPILTLPAECDRSVVMSVFGDVVDTDYPAAEHHAAESELNAPDNGSSTDANHTDAALARSNDGYYIEMDDNFHTVIRIVNGTMENFPSAESFFPTRFLPHPAKWFVHIGDASVGVLVGRRHVLTLTSCIAQFKLWHSAFWFSSYHTFEVDLFGDKVQVLDVKEQQGDYSPYPLALLTLAEHNVTEAAPLCVGEYVEGHPTETVTLEKGTSNIIQYQVMVSRCKQDNNLMCAFPGAAACGSPLLLEDYDGPVLAGLNVDNEGEIARYVNIGPARGWLGI